MGYKTQREEFFKKEGSRAIKRKMEKGKIVTGDSSERKKRKKEQAKGTRQTVMDYRAEQKELRNRDRERYRKTSQRSSFHREATNPAASQSQGFGNKGRSCTSPRIAPPPCPSAPTTCADGAPPDPAPRHPLLLPHPPPLRPFPLSPDQPSPLPGARGPQLAPPLPPARPGSHRDGQSPSGQTRRTHRSRQETSRHPRPPRRPRPTAPGGPDPHPMPARRKRVPPPARASAPGGPRFRPLLRHRAATHRGRSRRHGAAGQPPPEGLPRRPRRDPLRPGGLHQPALLPHRGSAQQARPRREVPGAARLPRPAAQRPRREGGGAQPGAAAPLVGLRRAALPARGEAAGSGGVPAAPPHDGDRRREAAAASAGGRSARCGRLGRARRRILRDAPGEELPRGPGQRRPSRMRLRPAPSGYPTTLKCHLHTLHSVSAAFSGLHSEKFTVAARSGAANIKEVFLL